MAQRPSAHLWDRNAPCGGQRASRSEGAQDAGEPGSFAKKPAS